MQDDCSNGSVELFLFHLIEKVTKKFVSPMIISFCNLDFGIASSVATYMQLAFRNHIGIYGARLIFSLEFVFERLHW